jgi:uncharacterized protein
LRDFWDASAPTVQQDLELEAHTVMQQIQNGTEHTDKSLSDLARRFLARNRFAMIEPPPTNNGLGSRHAESELALADLVKSESAFDPEMYILTDTLKAECNQPYFPEKEAGSRAERTRFESVWRTNRWKLQRSFRASER